LPATGTNQQPLLFADDFEHEDTSLWSSTVGLP